MAISPRGVVRSTSCLVLGGVFDRMALFPAGPSSIGRPMQEKTMRDESLDWSQSKVFLVTVYRFALLINYRMLYTQMDCQL